jgi:hypothetical protein
LSKTISFSKAAKMMKEHRKTLNIVDTFAVLPVYEHQSGWQKAADSATDYISKRFPKPEPVLKKIIFPL